MHCVTPNVQDASWFRGKTHVAVNLSVPLFLDLTFVLVILSYSVNEFLF